MTPSDPDKFRKTIVQRGFEAASRISHGRRRSERMGDAPGEQQRSCRSALTPRPHRRNVKPSAQGFLARGIWHLSRAKGVHACGKPAGQPASGPTPQSRPGLVSPAAARACEARPATAQPSFCEDVTWIAGEESSLSTFLLSLPLSLPCPLSLPFLTPLKIWT